MNNLKSGDILLYRSGQDALSKIIAWGTNSIYSHVAVCSDGEKFMIIDAMPGGGVNVRKIQIEKENFDVYRIKENYEYDLDSTLAYLTERVGRPYDFLGVMWLGLLKGMSKLNIKLKNSANNWQKKKDYFCSELCYEAFFNGGGIDIVPDVQEADITSPADISTSHIVEQVSIN